jgi:hypothetical protein
MIATHESLQSSDHRSPNPPTERDLEIYAAVRVDGRRQVDVAGQYGITQGRVSQIVRHVNHWRVGMGADADLEHRDQQTVDRWLDAQRIEKLYEETMELYRRSCQPRRKERRGTDHRGEWTTESIDHQPGNLQCLKLAARLIELKSQLSAPPQPPQEKLGPLSQVDEYDLYRRLVDMRGWAVQRGSVEPSEGKFDDSEWMVKQMLSDLLGRSNSRPRYPAQPPADPTNEPHNEPPVISAISAAEAAQAAEQIVATDSPAASYDAEPISGQSAPETNNSDVFASSAGQVESDRPHDTAPQEDEYFAAVLAPRSGDAVGTSIASQASAAKYDGEECGERGMRSAEY